MGILSRKRPFPFKSCQLPNDRIGSSLDEVTKSLEALPFTRNEIESAWNTGAAEGEDVTTRWGLTQGFTAFARNQPFADRRVNLERRAAALLS